MAHEDKVQQLLTAEEVAALLRVTKNWVYAAARRGDLPCVKVGRYIRFDRAEVDDWIKAGGGRDRS